MRETRLLIETRRDSRPWVCFTSVCICPAHGRPQMGSADPPGKMDEKLKSENMQKKSSFLCLCCILRAIRTGRCRERRYADHIFIQIYFKMHHFVVKFSKFSSPQATRGHWRPNQNPADVPGPAQSASPAKQPQTSAIARDWPQLLLPLVAVTVLILRLPKSTSVAVVVATFPVFPK